MWPPGRFHCAIAILTALWIGMPLAVHANHGVPGLEKLFTRYAMPLGIIWHACLLGFLIEWVRGKRITSLILAALTVFVTIAGSEPFGSWLNARVEYRLDHQAALPATALDTTVLLGGSTRVDRRGIPELAIDGQRLFYAAQIYHAGKTKEILVTGSNHTTSGEQISPAQQAKQLLVSIGVPADSIRISGGANTREEIKALANYFQHDRKADRKIGLITNATHLVRAMRLAKNYDLDFEPLPCVYRGGPVQMTLLNWMPCASGLHANTDACYELLAKLAGQ